MPDLSTEKEPNKQAQWLKSRITPTVFYFVLCAVRNMTIKELKEKIKDLPDYMDVFVDERLTEFRYGLVNSAEVREINFMEEPDGEVLSTDKVFVLTED